MKSNRPQTNRLKTFGQLGWSIDHTVHTLRTFKLFLEQQAKGIQKIGYKHIY